MPIRLPIPDYGQLDVTKVLFDLNGTLARDGIIAESTRQRLVALGQELELHVLSADTHGTLEAQIEGLPLQAQRVPETGGREAKRAFLMALGAGQTIAVGNGRNDVAMLEAAIVGIAVIGPEGAATEALRAADIVFTDIDTALDSLIHPRRLLATLRG